VAEPFASLGVSYALLALPRLDRRTIDSAFWLSVFGGVASAALLALGAPIWAGLFGSRELAPLVAIAGLKLIPLGLLAVPQQRLARALRHRDLAAAAALATLLSAAVRVLLAVRGFGAWSFVLSQHTYALALAASLWLRSPLKPRPVADRRVLGELARLGLPSSLGTSVGLLARNLDMLFVGRWFGIAALGLYRVAFDLAVAPSLAIGDVIARSAAPTLRRLLREPAKLRATFRYAVRLALLVCLPVAAFTAAMAPDLLTLAKDPSFVAAAPTARILVLAALLMVVFGLYGPLAQAIAHPELGLWSNLELFVLLATSLWACLSLFGPFLSIGAVAIAWCVALIAALLSTRHRFQRALAQRSSRRAAAAARGAGPELPGAYRKVV
jgi:O-antigen/teichoic acid export membrane protein